MKAARANEQGIAVMGGHELVNALRLAGVALWHVAEARAGEATDISRTVRGWISGGKVGLILIEEELVPFAADVIASARARKSVLPVILEVPAREVSMDAAAAYYKALSREYLGLDVVLEAEESPDGEHVSNPT